MATAEEILKKAKNRKKRAFDFKPEKRRAWDFVFEKKEPNKAGRLKYGNNIGTKKEQYGNNIKTILEQKRNNTETIPEQSKNKNGNKIRSKKALAYSKENQSRYLNLKNKLPDQQRNNCNVTTEVLCVMNGIQNKIIRQIISHIKNQPNKNYFIDIPISILARKINASKESVRVSIKRLQKKNILVRLCGEKGRYGNTKVNIPENVVRKYFELFNDPPCNIHEYGNNIGTKLEQNINKYRNNQNSSSSYNTYKTTTEDAQNPNQTQIQLPTEWQNIDIEPLSKIGFTINHLSQIAVQNKLTPQTMQDSIYAFAFDLQENDKAKKINSDPINFFMGILRKKGEPYAPPSNYESPQDKAMRIYLERMREIEQGRAAAEKEAINLAYNDWFTQLADEQKKAFLPTSMRQGARLEKNKMLEGSARNYFETEIWPEKKREIIGKTNIIEKEANGEKIAKNNST